MDFYYEDFQDMISQNRLEFPSSFAPYNFINNYEYSILEENYINNGNSIDTAFNNLRRRVSENYFHKIYPTQSRILDYSANAFPAYKFILPEILTEDWLAIVDWHKFQRDHALHQPLCAYIVNKLLNPQEGLIINDKLLIDHFIDQLSYSNSTDYLKLYLKSMGIEEYSDSHFWLQMENSNLWKALIIETANLAAVFHDLGYPWQYINLLSNKLSNIGVLKGDIANEYESVFNQFARRLFLMPFNKYNMQFNNQPFNWSDKQKMQVSKALKNTHGLPGALGFLYLYDVISNYPIGNIHPIRQFCVEWAAMAIMMHDFCKFYWGGDINRTSPEYPHLRVNFNVDPLSFIVTLADLIQEFERPDAKFVSHSEWVKLTYKPKCASTEVSIDGNEMKIIFKYEHPEHVLEKNSFINNARENFLYFDRINGFLGYDSLGLSSIQMQAELV